LRVEPYSIKRPVVAPRTVIAYHGCSRVTAETILTENRFVPSTNAYDWLGEGVYFWEYAPFRALDWAILRCARSGQEPAVVGAKIHLGNCLNLLDTQNSKGLIEGYKLVDVDSGPEKMPKNTDRGAHFLDRLVVDAYCRSIGSANKQRYQTVRGCYPEGTPIFPGSKLLSLTHVQIAVRDAACISNIHLVQY